MDCTQNERNIHKIKNIQYMHDAGNYPYDNIFKINAMHMKYSRHAHNIGQKIYTIKEIHEAHIKCTR